MIRDVQYAVRLTRRHPGPVVAVVLGLALAIGAASSTYAVIDALFLRSYGMRDPSTVFKVGSPQEGPGMMWPHEQFMRMQRSATVAGVEASIPERVTFSRASDDGGAGERALFVSGGYLEVLGAPAFLGRSLQAADDRASSPPVFVVSHQFWRSQLDADPRAIGQVKFLNGAPATLVGVLASGFTGPVDADRLPGLWIPFGSFDDLNGGTALDATNPQVEVFARVLQAASPRAAEEQLSAIIREAHGSADQAREGLPPVRLYGASAPIDGPNSKEAYLAILILAGLASVVLAAACANSANLLLAAAALRKGEMGVRLSLGASPARLVRQTLTEGVVIGGLSTFASVLVALWLVPILRATLDLPADLVIDVNWRVLLLTVFLGLACSVGASLSPARYGASRDVLAAVRAQGAGNNPATHRLRTSFVAFQSAASIFLLVLTGFLSRTATEMTHADVGLDIEHLLVAYVKSSIDPANVPGYVTASLAATQSVPAVERVSVTQFPPFSNTGFGREFSQGGTTYRIAVHYTDPDFFGTAGIRLLKGRVFARSEMNSGAAVALISETLARGAFREANPIGQSTSAIPSERNRPDAAIIIGVVDDALLNPPTAQAVGTIYRPLQTRPANASPVLTQPQSASVQAQVINYPMAPPGFLIRTQTPRATARAVEQALERAAPGMRFSSYIVRDRFEEFLRLKRVMASLILPVASLALLLSVLGLFGVTHFTLRQRMKEVSLRLALGATPSTVVRQLSVSSGAPVLAGLAVGLVLALGAVRFSARYFPGISPYDPVVVTSALGILLGVSVFAIVIPAASAAKSDPARLFRDT